MKASSAAGFTLVEMIMAAALMCAITAVLLQLALMAQQAVIRQDGVADLQQRMRVASSALQRDLLLAGAGPSQGPARGGLANHFPPILPARSGLRDADPELSYASDRISVLYVPDSRSQTSLVAAIAGPSAPLLIDAGRPGCPPDDSCGFSPGDRALVFDSSGSGAYDIFTVGSAGAGQIAGVAGSTWSHLYPVGSPVAAVIQRVYYLDRTTRRLMLYDGDQSDGPLVDGVSELRFSYYEAESGAMFTQSELVDGPVHGAAPNRFDADLLRVRRVRVTLTLDALEAASTDSRPRRITFDVSPRNPGRDR
jgi:type II secretory pathway pseudopilin PulG